MKINKPLNIVDYVQNDILYAVMNSPMGKNKKSPFAGVSPEVLTPTSVVRGLIGEEEALKLYSRLRRNAVKRLDRVIKKGGRTAAAALEAKESLPTLRELRAENDTPLEVGKWLANVAVLKSDYRFSVTGLSEHQEKTLAGLHKTRAYRWINEDNLRQFSEFMDWSRAVSSSKVYDSKRVTQWWKKNKDKFGSAEELQQAYFKFEKNRGRQLHVQITPEDEKATKRKRNRKKGGKK